MPDTFTPRSTIVIILSDANGVSALNNTPLVPSSNQMTLTKQRKLVGFILQSLRFGEGIVLNVMK